MIETMHQRALPIPETVTETDLDYFLSMRDSGKYEWFLTPYQKAWLEAFDKRMGW